MADTYDYPVKIKVASLKGKCSHGHKVGDEWTVGNKVPAGLCLTAFGVLLPDLRTLMFGGSFPWGKDKVLCSCPDPDNMAVFELSRETLDIPG